MLTTSLLAELRKSLPSAGRRLSLPLTCSRRASSSAGMISSRCRNTSSLNYQVCHPLFANFRASQGTLQKRIVEGSVRAEDTVLIHPSQPLALRHHPISPSLTPAQPTVPRSRPRSRAPPRHVHSALRQRRSQQERPTGRRRSTRLTRRTRPRRRRLTTRRQTTWCLRTERGGHTCTKRRWLFVTTRLGLAFRAADGRPCLRT